MTGCLSGNLKVLADVSVAAQHRSHFSVFQLLWAGAARCWLTVPYFECRTGLLCARLFIQIGICLRGCKWGSHQHRPRYVQCAHTDGSVNESPFYPTTAFFISSVSSKQPRGLCDLTCTPIEVVLDLKDIALYNGVVIKDSESLQYWGKNQVEEIKKKKKKKKSSASLFLLSLLGCRSAITSGPLERPPLVFSISSSHLLHLNLQQCCCTYQESQP